MKSFLMYKGDPRIVGGMLVASGGCYEVEAVDASPIGMTLEITGASGSCRVLCPSLRTFMDEWESTPSPLSFEHAPR